MSTSQMITTFYSPPRWSQFKHSFVEWRRRIRSRGELCGLSDRSLRDIGLSRCDVEFEASKPFWMA